MKANTLIGALLLTLSFTVYLGIKTEKVELKIEIKKLIIGEKSERRFNKHDTIFLLTAG
jgi:hypothetical protein